MKVTIDIDPEQIKEHEHVMNIIYSTLAGQMTSEEEAAFLKSLNLYAKIKKAIKKV